MKAITDTFVESGDLIFTEPWCGDREKLSLHFALNTLDAEGAFIEIGSFEGRSTVYIANQIYPNTLHAIDPWTGAETSGNELEIYSKRPIEQHWDHNINVGTKGNVVKHKMKWEEFFETWKDPIAFMYLDGPHDYQNVLYSLGIIVPFISKGGVLLGDDYDNLDVFQAVTDYFGHYLASPVLPRHFLWENK